MIFTCVVVLLSIAIVCFIVAYGERSTKEEDEAIQRGKNAYKSYWQQQIEDEQVLRELRKRQLQKLRDEQDNQGG